MGLPRGAVTRRNRVLHRRGVLRRRHSELGRRFTQRPPLGSLRRSEGDRPVDSTSVGQTLASSHSGRPSRRGEGSLSASRSRFRVGPPQSVSAAIVSDVGRGKEGLTTQYCVDCKSRKSMKGFDIGRGLCAECRASRPPQVSRKVLKTTTRPTKPPPGPTSWKCPTCLTRIDVNDTRTALVRHENGRGDRCAGSGHQLPQRSTDALDYRVGGSFEGGRR